MTPPTAIDIQARADALFGITYLCHEIALSTLVSEGLSREEAEAEWRRRRYEAFLKRERRPFSSRFPGAGVWSSR
jgi:hypothetical protein